MSWIQWFIALVVLCVLESGLERVLREILSELRDINRATDASRALLNNIEDAAWTRN